MTKFFSAVLSLFSLFTFSKDFNPKTLVLPDNPTQEDFSFLKEELKGVQVVMLGERTHYDANVFEMKVKIAKYLNKEMDFKTIAFESGVYDVYKASQEIKKGTNTSDALKKSIFFFWSKTEEAKLLSYFIEKNNVNIYGFDDQITGEYGRTHLVTDLYNYCKNNKLKLDLNKADFELLMESINSYTFDEGDITYLKFESELQKLVRQISYLQESETQFYWTQIIKSIIAYGKDAYQKKIILSAAIIVQKLITLEINKWLITYWPI